MIECFSCEASPFLPSGIKPPFENTWLIAGASPKLLFDADCRTVETLKVVTPLLIIAAQTAAKTSVVRLPQNTQFLSLSYAFRRTKTWMEEEMAFWRKPNAGVESRQSARG